MVDSRGVTGVGRTGTRRSEIEDSGFTEMVITYSDLHVQEKYLKGVSGRHFSYIDGREVGSVLSRLASDFYPPRDVNPSAARLWFLEDRMSFLLFDRRVSNLSW